MATYIKGHKNFYPDIKPFTPDYKFLSATLDARQAIYDHNWKAQNDLYNRVVYSDLTNPNSIEYQRQFTEKLGPQLEKISGLDLSLQQNVESAKSVFAPFFQDDTVVYDMVWTGRFNDSVKEYNQLASSNKEEVRQLASADVGLQKLDIDRRKFMNAGRDEILNQPLPELVLDADLVRNAQKFLSELDPELTITMPVPNLIDTGKVDKKGNPIFKEDNKWIITQTNGSLIEGAAYEQIVNSLYNDPRVTKYYDAKSYVQANMFAREALESGQVASEDQGLQLWASETIARIKAKNLEYQGEAEYAVRKANQVNINWSNYAESNGIVPGSLDEQIMQNNLDQAEQLEAELNRYLNQNTFADSDDPDNMATYNKAATLLANYNMDMDMRTAARQFSQRGMKVEQEVNEYSLAEYESRLKRNEASHKYRLDSKLQDAKYNWEMLLKGGPGMGLNWGGVTQEYTGAGSNFTVDEGGEIILENDYTALDALTMEKDFNILQNEMVSMLPDMIVDSGKYDADEDGQYTIPLVSNPDPDNDSDWYTGDIAGITQILGTRVKDDDDLDTDQFEYRDAINNVFGEMQDYYNNTWDVHNADPNKTGDQTLFNSIHERLFGGGAGELPGLAKRFQLYNQAVTLSEEDKTNKINTINASLLKISENDLNSVQHDIREVYGSGWVPPLDDNGNFMSKDAYMKKMYKTIEEAVSNGELDPNQDIDEKWAIDFDLVDDNAVQTVPLPGGGFAVLPVLGQLDRDQIDFHSAKVYDYFYTRLNELTANTSSNTYYNNSRGITSTTGGSNISFKPSQSITSNLNPAVGTDKFMFLKIMQEQMKSDLASATGGSGFVGYTSKDVKNLYEIDSDQIDYTDRDNVIAGWIWDKIITNQASLGDNSKTAFKTTFFSTWGPEVYGENNKLAKDPLAAYQFSNFDDALIKAITNDNTNYPIINGDKATKADIQKVLNTGFTYLFPRASTISANPASYKRTDQGSWLKQNLVMSKNNIFNDSVANVKGYFKNNAPHGRVKAQLVGNNVIISGAVHVYQKDASKYPNGYSVEPFPKRQLDMNSGEEYYDYVMKLLNGQKVKNNAAYKAASNAAIVNNQ